jgi:hypothetical protein
MTDEKCTASIYFSNGLWYCELKKDHVTEHRKSMETFSIVWPRDSENEEHDPKLCGENAHTCLCRCNNCVVHHWMGL